MLPALKRKPGALARSALLDDLFPRTEYRQMWAQLKDRLPEAGACRLMVGLLDLVGIDQDEAGRYRRENVVISGASTTPPDFLHIDREMQQLIQWHERSARMHVIERAAELHARFVKIHPFVDGNGRTGRLLMNFELMKEGYPPTVIRKEDRLAYYDALDDACLTGDHGLVTGLVADAVLRSLEMYLELLPQK